MDPEYRFLNLYKILWSGLNFFIKRNFILLIKRFRHKMLITSLGCTFLS